jgi:tol-pal system protein YbgF
MKGRRLPAKLGFVALSATLLAPIGCGGAAQDMAVLKSELAKVEHESEALSRRVGDLEEREALRKADPPAAADREPVVAVDRPRPIRVVKLAPEDAPPAASATAPGLATVDASGAAGDGDDDDGSPRPFLRIGPGGAVEQSLPDDGVVPTKGKRSAASSSAIDPKAATDYESAMSLVKAKKHKAALDALASFLVRWPDHPYAANALYWRGECYAALGDHASAVAQLEGVLARFPASAKVPDALLKLGLSYRKLGADKKAQASFDRIRKEFPSSEAAKKIPREDAP